MPLTLSDDLVNWLSTGERGLSSEAIVHHLTGFPINGSFGCSCHPLDPSDFRRCRLLLEAVPALAPRLGEMAAVSPTWAALVRAWPEMCACFDQEVPQWRRRGSWQAPKTYALMQQVQGRSA